LEIDPKCTDALHNKGYALDNLGKYDDAIACFDEAVILDVDNVAAIYSRSRSKAKKGDTGGSLVDLDKAKKLFNNDQMFVKYVQDDEAFDTIKANTDFKKLINEESSIEHN
jgi:tetratricopeptide (TPR) repeat protein